MNQVHVIDQIHEYALDILDPLEKRLVEVHIAQCPSCSKELKAYQRTVGMLALSVPQIEPPVSLKAAIMKNLPENQPQLDVQKLTFFDWLSQGWTKVLPAWGAISLVLILALTVSTVVLWRQVQNVPQAGAPTSGFKMIAMEGTGSARNASGVILLEPTGVEGTLVVNGLPALAKDNQYQLWLIVNGKRTNGGVFSVDQDGYAVMEVYAPQPLSAYPQFGITVEPAGGSPAPTGEKVMGGTL